MVDVKKVEQSNLIEKPFGCTDTHTQLPLKK